MKFHTATKATDAHERPAEMRLIGLTNSLIRLRDVESTPMRVDGIEGFRLAFSAEGLRAPGRGSIAKNRKKSGVRDLPIKHLSGFLTYCSHCVLQTFMFSHVDAGDSDMKLPAHLHTKWLQSGQCCSTYAHGSARP